jgi:hypothetical protein
MLCFYGKNKIMNDKDFKIIYSFLGIFVVLILLLSSLESYMQYLTRKEMIELFKTNNTKWSAEQIQGLVNSSK